MDSHEIVRDEIQGERSIVVLPFLAEGIRLPGESANLHSHGQVLALDMRRAKPVGVGLTGDRDYLH